jgi:glycosyltransferase involved in cell wall biosynthesis
MSSEADLAVEGSQPSILIVGYFVSWMRGRHSTSEDLASYLRSQGWKVLEASPVRNPALRVANTLRTVWTARRNYAVAHVSVYSGRPFIWAYMACWLLRRAGRPYALSLHGGRLPDFAKRFPRTVRRLLRSATVVTAPSEYLRRDMRRYHPDIIVLENALSLAPYAHRCLSQARPKLIWLRSLHHMYNPRLAIEVVALLRPEYPEIELTMIGAERQRGMIDSLIRLAEERGLDTCVRIVPGVPRDEIPDWLRRADIFLNTTNVDNAPVSVFEAMAAGLCVVSTNAGGLPDVLECGVDSLLTPCNDASRMADATKRLLTDPVLAQTLSTNARRKAERVDWSAIGPRWSRILRQASGLIAQHHVENC